MLNLPLSAFERTAQAIANFIHPTLPIDPPEKHSYHGVVVGVIRVQMFIVILGAVGGFFGGLYYLAVCGRNGCT
jgi:hypothetical protein